MKQVKIISAIGIMTMFLSVVLVNGATVQSTGLSPKVRSTLVNLERATSFEQVAQEMKRASLSKGEQDQLREALPKTIKMKIERLAKEARSASRDMVSKRVMASEQRLKFHTRQIEARQAQSQTQARNTVQAVLKQVRMSRKVIAKTTMSAALRPPATAPKGSIHLVDPNPVVAGQAITITGDDFGAATGRVKAILGAEDRFDCPVTGWSSSRIVATVPLDVEALVRERSRSGYIQISPAGGGSGPWTEVTFAPDLTRLTPVITGVSPDPIIDNYPDVVIQGRNFLEAKGSVTSSYPDSTDRRGDQERIKEWSDTYIVLDWTPLSCRPERVSYTVRNHLGRESTATFRVQTTSRTMLVRGSEREKHCELWADGAPSVFCLVGQKETVTVKVGCGCGTSRILEVGFDELESGGISSGRAWKTQPRANRYEGSYEIWAEAYSWIKVRPWFVVEVPYNHECHNAAP